MPRAIEAATVKEIVMSLSRARIILNPERPLTNVQVGLIDKLDELNEIIYDSGMKYESNHSR